MSNVIAGPFIPPKEVDLHPVKEFENLVVWAAFSLTQAFFMFTYQYPPLPYYYYILTLHILEEGNSLT